jgi:hypothetical protein
MIDEQEQKPISLLERGSHFPTARRRLDNMSKAAEKVAATAATTTTKLWPQPRY